MTMLLLGLPAEVVEAIAVEAAASKSPCSIAALAQTCRTLRALIYGASDRHLWREVFLTTFDDPRATRGWHPDFDWGVEFRKRIWTQRYLRAHTEPIVTVESTHDLRSKTMSVSHSELPSISPADGARVIWALISVVKTAQPVNRFPDPPYALITESTLNNVHLQTVRNDLPTFDTPSLNIQWLRRTLEHGLPPGVIGKYSGEYMEELWLATPEAQSLGQLICFTGFLPVPTKESPEGLRRATSEAASQTQRSSSEEIDTDSPLDPNDMSTEAQENRARWRARERVYNMSYPKRRRGWGPFRAVTPMIVGPHSEGAESPNSGSEANRRTVLVGSDLDSSSSDSDFVTPDEDSSGNSSATPPPPAREPNLDEPLRRRLEPTGAQLLPDWPWLAAARIICEANLRDPMQSVTTVDVDQLCRWDGVREGTWAPAPPKRSSESAPSAKGKEKADVSVPGKSEVNGWDWAGVEGVWKRCVCWLDYSDLIDYNLDGGYDDPSLIEAMLIVPLRLRISGYSPPAVPTHTDRPTIQIEGDMGGPGWTGELGEGDDFRRVHGSVSTVADGSIRWCMYTCESGSPRLDQWASEGIQIGGVGSAMGIVGLWTGASHEDSDPIGPFWQWRVA